MTATSAAVLQQVLPLIVLILVPALVLRLFAFVRPRIRGPIMALGALLRWNWGGYSPTRKGAREREEAEARPNARGTSRRGQEEFKREGLFYSGCGLGCVLSWPRQYVWNALFHEFYASGPRLTLQPPPLPPRNPHPR
ncbi:hypothetical protein MVEN_01175400 [Mycena venus]|uniref:Uncharacterized protein n=1 Tax=Mycena venus TaxID=2733690 RepID=A0A8H7CYI7_9AGAR|nr:hypothetical protein MVEN_01175400 [Mycena venus]